MISKLRNLRLRDGVVPAAGLARTRQQTVRSLLFVLAVLAFVGTVRADDLIPIDPDDPETVHIGPGVNTTCATGDSPGCQIYGGEVNALTSNQLSIYMNGSGNTQQNPILLLVGVPNVGAGATLPTITSVGFYENYPQTGIPVPGATPTPGITGTGTLGGALAWGGAWNTATGYAGSLTGTNSGNNTAYQIAHLSAGGSESFVNWSSADSAVNGIAATSFGIYVYELNIAPPSWDGNDLINVTFGGAGLQQGDFAITWSCSVTSTPCGSKNTYSVPFTQAGLVTSGTSVPEPGSLALLASGIALLGVARRRNLSIVSVRH